MRRFVHNPFAVRHGIVGTRQVHLASLSLLEVLVKLGPGVKETGDGGSPGERSGSGHFQRRWHS
jgi:hypothetical protein